MLHILTPLFRYSYLEKIYESLPKNDDIRWHIAKSNSRPALNFEFIDDTRITVYSLDCDDTDVEFKRNFMFDKVKDGFFYLLDDDTIFLEACYELFKEIEKDSTIKMAIANQILFSKVLIQKAILPLIEPIYGGGIDSGMVICHSSVLKKVKWENVDFAPNDYYLWYKCYQLLGRENTKIYQKEISYYNYFEAKIRIRKNLFGFRIKIDINSPFTVIIYSEFHWLKRWLRQKLHIKRMDNSFPYNKNIKAL
jgi:hypothetical protein